ncbi:hypothetical protein ACFQV4_37135 [Streptomyces thermocarboxydus]
MFAHLRANKADADYLKSFYEALGSRRLLWLSNDMGDRFNDQYKDHPEQREKDRLVIAETFGSFTKVAFEGKTTKEKQRLWNKWFDDSAMDEYEGFRPDRLTPFLKGETTTKTFWWPLVIESSREKPKPMRPASSEMVVLVRGNGERTTISNCSLPSATTPRRRGNGSTTIMTLL